MNGKQEKNWEFQISQYLDGLLSEAESAELQAKLQADPALRETLSQYQALEENLKSLADEQPAIDFDSQREWIMSRVSSRAQTRHVKGRRLILRSIYSACAVAAVLLVAFGVFMIARTHLPSEGVKRAESLALRPSPVQPGKVIATILPASPAPKTSVKGMVQVLAKRMDGKPARQAEKPAAGTVVVSIGSPGFTNEEEVIETATDEAEEYWF